MTNPTAARVGAFFDVDETMVRGATSFWAAREMFRRKFFGPKDLLYAARQTLKYVLFGEDRNKIGDFANRAARVVAGNSLDDLRQLSNHLYDEHFADRMYKATYQRALWHLEQGHQVWLVSATPWIVAEVFAERLGVSGGVGTKTKVDGGRLLGELDGVIVHGEAKVEAIEEIAHQQDLDLHVSWAYSDSANDIPMLNAVGNPVAVNPDRLLSRYAHAHGWRILEARTPADKWRRRAIKGGLAAAAASGAWKTANYLYRVARENRR